MDAPAPRRRAVDWLKLGILALCLLAPSIWMMMTIPPLWRDVDGYNQLIHEARLTTFWGFGPAYGNVAKVPVVLAGLIEHWVTGAPMFPALSDTSVGALIACQHLALAAAALGFVCAVAQLFWVRLGLALLWASNALFYTFAHSVGSESLSVIVVILFVTQCVRLQAGNDSSWTRWLLFAVTLLLCLLCRQINGLLILLLPAASFLEWLFLRSKKSSGRLIPSRASRRLVLSLLIGIGTVIVANSLTQNLAGKSNLRPHSRLGATFVWRLQFLSTLPAPTRDAVLQAATNRVESEDARRLLAVVREMCNDQSFAPSSFTKRAVALVPEDPAGAPWVRFDRALNQIAHAFLLPPKRELLDAVRTDVAEAARKRASDVSNFLFGTTAFYFKFQTLMPRCANLVTFRNYNAETLEQLPEKFAYFNWWRGLDYYRGLLLWLAGLAAFVVIAWRKRTDISRTVAFAIALVAVGFLVMVANCLLTELLPRYLLPMWQLLDLSLFFLVARLADLCSRRPMADANRARIANAEGK